MYPVNEKSEVSVTYQVNSPCASKTIRMNKLDQTNDDVSVVVQQVIAAHVQVLLELLTAAHLA
jgi:GTP cyclohydrolase FolE2